MMSTLTRDQQQASAHYLGIPLATLQAVQEVEARSCGFLHDGRPIILFERHIMYRQCASWGLDADKLTQTYPNLVNKSVGGYQGSGAEHYRLTLAKQIHTTSAIESASWGLFQIMGFHWKTLGYRSASDFEEKMNESEEMQLEAFVRFIEAHPKIHKALKSQSWQEFARRYNGPQYKRNQ